VKLHKQTHKNLFVYICNRPRQQHNVTIELHYPTSSTPVPTVVLSELSSCKFWWARRIEALPADIGEASDDHPLATFTSDPVGYIGEHEDAWDIFDGPLNTLLQRPLNELQHPVLVGGNGL
jgi:hypothetical protein